MGLVWMQNRPIAHQAVPVEALGLRVSIAPCSPPMGDCDIFNPRHVYYESMVLFIRSGRRG